MTERPFSFEGSERQLFLTSLREFSVNCEPPALTPECPFYVRGATGPVCGEECHDILAEFSADPAERATLSFGDGIELVRRKRRVRRGPEPSQKPFDAAEIRLSDNERPTDLRSTVSLFSELDLQASTPPVFAEDHEERAYLIRASVDELCRRGFSRDELTDVVATITSYAQAVYMVHDLLLGGEDDDSGPDAEWLEIRKLLAPALERLSRDELPAAVFSPTCVGKIAAWNRSLSIDEIAAWNLPSTGFFSTAEPVMPFTIGNSGWIFDRFTRTYLSDWLDKSLACEWRYLRSDVRGCARSDQMKIRRIGIDELSREMAGRFADHADQEERREFVNPGGFKLLAIEKLRAGSFEAAATIFEGLLNLRPDDPETMNNYGFCLMPLDLERARNLITKAISLANRPPTIWYANLVLCHILEGQMEKAEEAVRAMSSASKAPSALLWRVDDRKAFSLYRFTDIEQYVLDLLSAVK
ncbi:tetratricopeptide repeat protein [Catellatospora vulcania]|uniref:tetratricopeptide repeat protein n=1 Tax=Catellatospora vulcania TaxID=1460450 RepID=UPI0012D41B95|nr:hypothetical protein [Catellatospora vulcania]